MRRVSAALVALLLGPSVVAAQEAPIAPVPAIETSVPQIAVGASATTEPDDPARHLGDRPLARAAEDGAPAQITDPHNRENALSVTEGGGGREPLTGAAPDASTAALRFLQDGGPSIWAIALLSVITLALILWKIWRLAMIGAWSRSKAGQAVLAYETENRRAALAIVEGRRGIRSRVVAAALSALDRLPEDRAREETARVAKRHLASAATGLGALELIATIAPLLGLLGTVLGMIAAFQALQAAGARADPALLAGGIWEALLTTAAGMAVAIPASAALTWFEAVIARIRRDIEDSATRLFVAAAPAELKLAAE
nr:MotA/TolQ/ExbB proton channel family protein [Phaeobacter sp. HF9A]